ncbi:MAG TPA: DNA polymerase, partial [Sphingomicrobium sp.]|nr:DNA polymerase [Sphingomicrobium sp.]
PPGYTLVEFDASGQEYRWMAVCSGDETMLQLCLPGEDPHSYMGARIVERDYRELMRALKAEDEIIVKLAEDNRKLGKVGNLSLQYRTSAMKLRTVARVQYNIPLELPQAQIIHATYQRTYVRVPEYWKVQIAETKRLGYVETLAGRRVQVRGNWGGEFGWSMGSTAINYRIQGTGGDQKYLGICCLDELLTDVGAYFAWDLHDGIYFWVPDAKVQTFVARGKAILDNLPYKKAWGFVPPIPLPWDSKAGPGWGYLKDYTP